MVSMKKYILVIPTFTGHLIQVKLFLESFVQFCKDKKKIPVKLIISESDSQAFAEIVEEFSPLLNLEILTLKTILQAEENISVDENELLKKVGKFNFQSLKKIYGVKYFDHDCALVLDSEALLIRPTKFSEIFEDFLKKKFIIYSKHGDNSTQLDVTENVLKILKKKFHDMWMFEYQYWFYEKERVNQLFTHIQKTTKKTLYQNLESFSPIFEFNLYTFYLFFFHRKKYTFIDAEKLLSKYLGKKLFAKYKEDLKAPTLFEYCSWGLTPTNKDKFARLFKEMHLHFFKYDDRSLLPGNVEAQQAFVQQNSTIKLLPCRVVSSYFEVNGSAIPINHDAKKNRPLMNQTESKSITEILQVFSLHFHQLRETLFFWKEFLRLYTLRLKVRPPFDENRGVFLDRVQNKKTSRKLSIDTKLCFDVGAYTGNSIKRLKSLGYTKILCFEPSPNNFLQLFQTYGTNKNLAFMNAAATSKAGDIITFYQNPYLPWLNTANIDWIQNTRHKSLVPRLSATKVHTTTLDRVIELIGVIPHYIKIDVEGHELEVLKGLHIKPKMVSFEWISERGKQNIAVAKECQRLGFTNFYFTEQEDVPKYTKKYALTFAQLLKKWKEIAGDDRSNSRWGSIWCR